MSDVTDAKASLSVAAGSEAKVDKLTDFSVQYRRAIDAAANTAMANDKFWTNPHDFSVRIVRVVLNPDGVVAKAAANYANVIVKTDDGIGDTPAAAFAFSTASGSLATGWAANIAQVGSGSATACVVPPGGSIYGATEKNASGVTLPPLSLGLTLRRV